MRKIAHKIRILAMSYLKWAWPLLLADSALSHWAGEATTLWRAWLNGAAFLWVVLAPIAPLTLLLDRSRRERAMARLCGLREGDERERAVTGEAARATLLLSLTFQVVLLVMSMISVHLAWDPSAPKGERGLVEVGMGFSSSRHLDPFGTGFNRPKPMEVGVDETRHGGINLGGGFILAPSIFPILALLILIQLAAFRILAVRRYEGAVD
ncbi:MAG: hypothetical protein HY551_07930 [Elusimicrobia bacterium]|nr:hypothetical protein [Elusimicrobiota bacterium]